MHFSKIKFVVFLATIIIGASFVLPVHASNTNGTIDASYKYAWSDQIGWINFGCTNCGIAITDSGITGYAWNDNYGWINLGATNSGISNNNEGTLSGSAWGENLGWIDFSGVIINSSGVFTGTATGDNVGTINFDCSNCDVRTDWRPRGNRPACNNLSDDDGDGKIDYPDDPECISLDDDSETNLGGASLVTAVISPMVSNPFPIIINKGEKNTYNNIVDLELFADSNVKKMVISNSPDFIGVSQIPFYPKIQWDLCSQNIYDICKSEPTIDTPPEKVKVYVRFYNKDNIASPTYWSEIILNPPQKQPKEEILVPITEEETKTKKSIIDKIADIVEKIIPDFLKPDKDDELPPARIIPLETPLVFRGDWTYLPELEINKFVFAPISKELDRLVKSFPVLEKTFNELGVKRMTDVVNIEMSGTKFGLPGISLIASLPNPELKVNIWKLPEVVPLVKTAPEVKNKIPAEVLFARSGSELIDYNMSLTFGDNGRVEQKISTVVGKPLHLVVRPKAKVKKVKGYLVFKEMEEELSQRPSIWKRLLSLNFHNSKNKSVLKSYLSSLPMSQMFSSLFFSSPTLANEQAEEINREERMVLLEFEYTDPDGDGLYTADIISPVVDGEYEIITVLHYNDPLLGVREIRLITVVDPEGYIYEKFGKREARISDAKVSIFWKNPSTKEFELWNAKKYQQQNPQKTDITGKYSFLVPPGEYRVEVEVEGYDSFKSKAFIVEEGRGIHQNIEMRVKYWWIKNIDWKTVALIFVLLALLYNFYKDKKRATKFHLNK